MAVRRVQFNAFGIAFGLVGLAGTWRLAAQAGLVAAWIGDMLLVAGAVVWVVTLAGYVRYASSTRGALQADLRDDVGSPFASLAVITPMLLAAQGVAPSFPVLGRTLVDVSVVLTLAIGSWMTGRWIHEPAVRVSKLHPGYFLPTVAGGLLAASATAAVGQELLARFLFGIGLISWLFWGPVIRARLIFAEPLPSSLAPTLAIEVAPPAAASLGYFALTGAHDDMFAAALAGYGGLMILAQLPLLSRFTRLSFTPSFWSFAFSWAVVASTTIVWLDLTRPIGYQASSYAILGAVTLLIGAIGARTVVEFARGRSRPAVVEAGYVPPTSNDSGQTAGAHSPP